MILPLPVSVPILVPYREDSKSVWHGEICLWKSFTRQRGLLALTFPGLPSDHCGEQSTGLLYGRSAPSLQKEQPDDRNHLQECLSRETRWMLSHRKHSMILFYVIHSHRLQSGEGGGGACVRCLALALNGASAHGRCNISGLKRNGRFIRQLVDILTSWCRCLYSGVSVS